jgi:hypothetical protein
MVQLNYSLSFSAWLLMRSNNLNAVNLKFENFTPAVDVRYYKNHVVALLSIL